MSFPVTLTNAIDGVTEIVAAHLNNLEAKVGADGSAVVSSLDYLLKNPASIDPGHKHTGGGLSGGADGDVFYKAAGAWTVGTPDAAGLVAKTGDQSISGIKTFVSIPVGPASDPTTGNQLARKTYVDLMLPLSGGNMSGNLAMGGYKVTGLAAASGAGEAVRYNEWISSISPGHKHSNLYKPDGSAAAVIVAADGNVAIGTTNAEARLNIDSTNTDTYLKIGGSAPGAGAWYLDSGGTEAVNAPVGGFGIYGWGYTRFSIDINGNVGIGTLEFGTAAAKVLGLGSGTEPTSAPADMAQMWVENINGAAGYAGLHKRTEGTNQKEVIPGVIIKTDTGSPANPYEGLLEINTYNNVIRMYADAGWRQLGSW